MVLKHNVYDMRKSFIILILVVIVMMQSPVVNSSYYNGIFINNGVIKVGVNNYGVFGVYDDVLHEIAGFQYPPGIENESLAYGWWGDGWSLFYDSRSAGFSVSDGAWGWIPGAPDISFSDYTDGYMIITRLITIDEKMRITIYNIIPNNRPYIIRYYTITNVGNSTVHNVEFKTIVDWDLWGIGRGSFDNYWGLDNIRQPDLNLAVAFLNESVSPSQVYMGFASVEPPSAIDLYWDDYYGRGISYPVLFYIDANGNVPASAYFDGAVVYDWLIGDLDPGQSHTIATIYAVGDTLEELENNTHEAFRIASVPIEVGGYLAGQDSHSNPLYNDVIVLSILIITSFVIINKNKFLSN